MYVIRCVHVYKSWALAYAITMRAVYKINKLTQLVISSNNITDTYIL